MGQGNAIAHLMPPPFYLGRLVVAKARAPEESISDQISKVRDASAQKRYKIEVMPGIYTESVTMIPFCDVVAPYGRVVIQPQTGLVGVTMANNSMLQGVQVDLSIIKAGANVTGISTIGKDNVIIEDVWVTGGNGGDIGMTVTNTGTHIIIRKCRIEEVATGLFKDGTGSLWFADNRVTAFTGGVDIDINEGTLNLMDNELMGQAVGESANIDVGVSYDHVTRINSFRNTLSGGGWLIANSANARVYSHGDNFLKVNHAGADGFMVCIEDVQTYYVYNGMHIGDALEDITDASDTKRYTIRVFSGEYNEAITMDRWVDLVGESNQSCVISQATGSVITCAANSRIKSVRVELTAADGTDNGIYANDIYAYIEDVVVVVTSTAGTNYGIATAGEGGFEIHDSVVICSDADDYPIAVIGSGNHFIYDSELINQTDSTLCGYGVTVGSGCKLNSFNNKLCSAFGFFLTSNASTQVLSYGDDFPNVVWSEDPGAGLFADLTGARLYKCAAGVKVGEWVYCSADDTVAEADADALATMPCIGVVVWKPGMPVADTGLTCYVKNYGYYYDANSNSGHGDAFVAGEEFWVSGTSISNPGEIKTTMHPVWPQRAGVAVDTQRFKILIGDNLGLVHCNEYLYTHGALAIDKWVYIKNVNDYVALARADAAGTMMAIGVYVARLVEGDGATPDTILVKLRGKYSQATPAGEGDFNPSDDIYIDPDVDGQITTDSPVGDIVQKVAEVKSNSGGVLIYEIAD